MGANDKEIEDANRAELALIRLNLTPEERHQWTRIRDTLPSMQFTSYRAAICEACEYVIGFEKVGPKDLLRMTENAGDIIREKILKNPVFKVA